MPAEKMTLPTGLSEFIGNGHVVDVLRRAIAQDRFPHALILAGPPGIGKSTLAILLARELNCLSPRPEGACGSCSLCRKIMAVLQSRYCQCISPKADQACGGCAACRTRADQHPDVRLIGPEKSTISIEQVRELITEVSYQPFEAKFRVFVLDPAELMRGEAQNSLLKTLEEPPSRTILMLVTANPYLLLQTIRSRSRLLNLGGIPPHQIEDFLVRTRKANPADARLAAIFSHGSLEAALSFDTGDFGETRSQALRFAGLLLARGSFHEASVMISALVKDKDKARFDMWLEAVETILQDAYFAGVAPERVCQLDLQKELAWLAARATRDDIVAGIEAFKKFRRALKGNINRQMGIEAIFLASCLR
jgi:DNA polymerase III subunit delta'